MGTAALNGSQVGLSGSFSPPGAPTRTLSAFSLSGGDLDFQIQALQEKQLVRSLAEPSLMMISGEKASFLAGGEIPVPISDNNGRITVEYKEFGIRLNMVATVTDEGKIHLQVSPEVSAIDPTNAFESSIISIPAITSRRVQTSVEILPGQSFVVGGLFNTEDNESISRLPIIGDLPIIGSFFKQTLRDKTDKEIVVIIRPEIISNDQAAQPTKTPSYAAPKEVEPTPGTSTAVKPSVESKGSVGPFKPEDDEIL